MQGRRRGWTGSSDSGYLLGNAREAARNLLQLDPANTVARRCLETADGKSGATFDRIEPHRALELAPPQRVQVQTEAGPSTKGKAKPELAEEYKQLMLDAEIIADEIKGVLRLSGLQQSEACRQRVRDLEQISRGEVERAVQHFRPASARETAMTVLGNRSRARELLVEDLEAVVVWASSQPTPLGPDALRDRLVKRRVLLEAALPAPMAIYTTEALALVERKFLRKEYVNSETMLGDAIADVPPANFFVSEDNYAWDMEELAKALAVNDGVMRNPLSKDMFSEVDIRRILAHPLGARLKPIRLAQSQLRRGLRPETIRRTKELGMVLLADQTENTAPSRSAMDEFLAYVATLPDSEQQTINSLKIPATDKLNGNPYDYTIGQSVQDAKANLTCLHKVRAQRGH